uniref:MHC class I-like antigen recognition-like domain-containing protein n=1 Tax=Oreochromis niloticus TaxID=8128 RepID=A0A669E5F9_ORENI
MDAWYVFLYFVTRMLTVNSATHSLIYIYTALSADLGLPGVHKFTAIGLLDGKPFDRFDTDNPRKTPTTNWARQHLTTEYLDKGTCRDDSDGHSASDGDYAYDAATEAAKPIADKWNGVTVLTEYTNGYLRDERATYSHIDLYGIGFLHKHTCYDADENGRVLSTDDGLKVFDILPNNDDTFQRRIAVDILQSDKGNFTCNVLEEDTGYHAIKHWRLEDRKTLRAVAWSNIVLLWALLLFSTMVFLCTAALYPVVVCIIRKRRTGQIANQTDSCAQHHGLKDETSGV